MPRSKTQYGECPPPYRIERTGEHSAVVYLTENAAEVVNGDERHWEADEYAVVTAYTPTLARRIESGLEAWIDHAKDVDYEKAAAEIRKTRDNLLASADWTQAQDTALPPDEVTAYKAYRQALRDIPEQAGFPYDVAWPKI